MTLYTYTIPYDDGAAPNPYWGIMTLAICKPVIRRNAVIGDWVVGTGSRNSPIGIIQNSIVYVMKVTDKLTMQEYDGYCRKYLRNKIPNIKSNDLRRHIGDCIYDFNDDTNGKLRLSVHNFENKKTDLGGQFVLLSNHFYYFGDHPIYLPQKFQSIIKSNQGHKSKSNDKIKEEFVDWILSLGIKKNSLIGKPQILIDLSKGYKTNCELNRKIDLKDEREWKKGIC